MSNHDGSYLINRILFLLNEYEVFNLFGKDKTLQFIDEIRKIGYDQDCNNGEMLNPRKRKNRHSSCFLLYYFK